MGLPPAGRGDEPDRPVPVPIGSLDRFNIDQTFYSYYFFSHSDHSKE
ncbi:hypothetical protein KPATCC21470_4058 [Kitasatospora purpeofusca]